MRALPKLAKQMLEVARFRAFDTSTEGGRSKERYRRAALTTFTAAGARAVSVLSSLISVPLTFRYLGSERYGVWMVLISIISSMTFADLGIGNGLINCLSEAYGKDDRRKAREYFASALVVMLVIAAFFAAVGAIAYPRLPWSRIFNIRSQSAAHEGGHAFLVLYAAFIVNIPLDVVTRAQAALQKAYLSQAVAALGSVLSLLAILLVIHLRCSLAWLVMASMGGAVIATAVNGGLLFKAFPWIRPSWNDFRLGAAFRMVHLGLMFFVLQCAVAVGYTSDNIVIAQVMGAAVVAAYAVPQKIFGTLGAIVNMALTPLWPAYGEAIARGDIAWVHRSFWISLRFIVATTVPLSALLVTCGPWILRLFFGKALHVPISVLAVLGIWAVVSAISSAAAVLLNGATVLKAQTVLAVLSSALNLAISIVLTKRYGVIGVCLGSISSQVLIAYPYYAWAIPKLFRELKQRKGQQLNSQAQPEGGVA